MAAPNSGRDARVVHLNQGTFGTAAGATDYGYIKGTSQFDIDHDLNVRESDMVTGQRWQIAADVRTDDYGAMPKLSENATVFKNNLNGWLAGMTQQVSGSVNSPFGKMFTFHTTQPDFAADEGHFETLVLQNVDASTDVAFLDAIVQELNFSVEPRGELTVDSNWVSRGTTTDTFNYTGTTGRIYSGSFHYEDMERHHYAKTGTGAGGALQLVGPVEITLSQDVVPIGVDVSGDGRFETYLITNKVATAKAKIAFNAAARNLKSYMKNDNAITIQFGWGDAPPALQGSWYPAGTDGQFDFSGSAKVTSWKEDLSEIYGVDVEFKFTPANDSDTLINIWMVDNQNQFLSL